LHDTFLSIFLSIFRHTQPIGTPNTLKGSVTQPAHDLVDSLARHVIGGPFEVPGPKVINEEFVCEYSCEYSAELGAPDAELAGKEKSA